MFSCSSLFSSFIMAKYYREVSELLKLGAESFEDELKRIVSLFLNLLIQSFLLISLSILYLFNF